MNRGLVIISLMGAAIGCGGTALNPGGTGGTGGGKGGASGTAGTGGDAGATGGSAGTSGTAGTGGTAGTPGTGGIGGATGTGGIGGATGIGGIGGTPGTGGIGGARVCIAAGQGDVVQFAIVGADAMLVGAPATATVSVASIDSCAQVTCPTFSLVSSGLSISAAASRFTLTAPGPQQWTFYLRDSVMPADLIKVGDTFDLTISAGRNSIFYPTIDQTMVLSRGGNLIFFAAGLGRSFHLATPNLDAFGIQISDAGTFSCQNVIGGGGPCTVRPHAAQVAVGGDNTILAGGQTSTIGWLSFTNASFTELDDTGGCDDMSATIMAGFRSP